jgi:hypothetical protein
MPSIKTRSSPTALSTVLCVPFPALHCNYHGPRRGSGLDGLLRLLRAFLTAERYDAASEKNASGRPPALIRSTTPEVVMRLPKMQDQRYPHSSLLNESITRPTSPPWSTTPHQQVDWLPVM